MKSPSHSFGPSLLAAAVLLYAATAPAQAFSASANGTVSAIVEDVPYGIGPAPIPAEGVAVSGFDPALAISASASARVVGNTLHTRVTASKTVLTSQSTMAGAVIDLVLQAPVGAGVRITLATANGTTQGMVWLTIAGQDYWPLQAPHTTVVDAVVPAGGLLVKVRNYASTGGLIIADSVLDVTWDYPGVALAGTPTPGCLGPAAAWTNGIPRLGNSAFALQCANAPSAGGFLALSLGGLPTPINFASVEIWLDPNAVIRTCYLASAANGDLSYPLWIPANPSFQGVNLWAQFLLLEPPNCTPSGLSGSNAIQVTLLP
ncbi:MAG: hypothetical protein ABL997_04765 [Planctomycetota bacterium]